MALACVAAFLVVAAGCVTSPSSKSSTPDAPVPPPGWAATDLRVMDPATYEAGPQRPEREPVVAHDPSNPSRAIAITTEEILEPQYKSWLRIFTSDDGGGTWVEAREVANSSDAYRSRGITTMVGDPTLVFDNNGTAYFAYLAGEGIAVERSTDGGHSWEITATIAPRGPDPSTGRCDSPDKELLAIDRSTSTLYMAWTRFSHECSPGLFGVPAPAGTVYEIAVGDLEMQIVLSKSTDGGFTWTEPQIIWDRQGIGAVPLAGPDGQVHVAFWSSLSSLEANVLCPSEYGAIVSGGQEPHGAVVVRSSPGGDGPWRTHVQPICDFNFATAVAAETGATRWAGYGFIAPAATVDAARNAVHVAFLAPPVGSKVPVVWQMHSDAGVSSWSEPQALGGTAAQDGFLPALAADAGLVHLLYAQVTQGDRYAIYHRSSNDGGESWTEPFQTSSRDYALTGDNIGDYNWIDASDGHVAAIWTGTSEDGEMRVWSRTGWFPAQGASPEAS